MNVFNTLKPQLTDKQLSLIGSFYKMSQERTIEQGAPYPIKAKEIHYYQDYNGSCSYAPDLFIIAIHAIDSEYIKNRCEQMRQESKKVK